MELLTASEMAQILRVDPSTIRRWAVEGRLRAVRLPSRGVRIPRSEVEKLLASAETDLTHA